MPAGQEEAARSFYCGILGMREIPKPAELVIRGGCWFESGGVQIHLGVENDFRPAKKAHPALRCATTTASWRNFALLEFPCTKLMKSPACVVVTYTMFLETAWNSS